MIVIHQIHRFTLGLAYACVSCHLNCEACHQGAMAALICLSYFALTGNNKWQNGTEIFSCCFIQVGINDRTLNLKPNFRFVAYIWFKHFLSGLTVYYTKVRQKTLKWTFSPKPSIQPHDGEGNQVFTWGSALWIPSPVFHMAEEKRFPPGIYDRWPRMLHLVAWNWFPPLFFFFFAISPRIPSYFASLD